MGDRRRRRAPSPSRNAEEERIRARDRLLSLVSFRPRSVQEVHRRLEEEGYAPEVVRQVIREGEARGWLDDAGFAKLWIEERLLSKPKGPRALRQELKAKGVAEQHIARALEQAELDEEALARRLIEQYEPRYRADDPQARTRKLVALLRRRGFSPQAIQRALRDRP